MNVSLCVSHVHMQVIAENAVPVINSTLPPIPKGNWLCNIIFLQSIIPCLRAVFVLHVRACLVDKAYHIHADVDLTGKPSIVLFYQYAEPSWSKKQHKV